MKATAEQVVAAYRETGSVWQAAKRLGMCGQSVWERLRHIGVEMQSTKWTDAEVAELKVLIGTSTLGQIALQLGRPYAGVACKASELGIVTRFGNKIVRKLPRGSGLTKPVVKRLLKEFKATDSSMREFCRTKSISLDSFAIAVQAHAPSDWVEFSKSRGITAKSCPNCGTDFYPMTQKQATCSRKCGNHLRADRKYFGGKRNQTIGLAEGVCQLCEQKRTPLASHHVLGKQNDPDNHFLIALCNGCHHIVGILAGRNFADDPRGWERLIELSMARRMAEKASGYVGTHVSVDMEYLGPDDLEFHIRKEGSQ